MLTHCFQLIALGSGLFFIKFEKKMIVERNNDEILVRFKAGTKITRIQTILDYLRYEELTSKSTATEEDVDFEIDKKWTMGKDQKRIGA